MEENNAKEQIVEQEPEKNSKANHKLIIILVLLITVFCLIGIGYYFIKGKEKKTELPTEIIEEPQNNNNDEYYLIIGFADSEKNIIIEKTKVSEEEYDDSQITAFNLAREKGYSFIGVYKCQTYSCQVTQQIKDEIYEINDKNSAVYFDFLEQEIVEDISNIDFLNDDLTPEECEANKIITNDELNKKVGNKIEVLNNATTILIETPHLFDYLLNSLKMNNLDNQDKLWLIYAYTKDILDFENTTSDELLKIIRKVFGSEFSIKFEDIFDGDKAYGLVMYKYDSSSKKYKYVGGGHGWPEYSIYNIKPIEFEEKDGKYYISYEILLSDDDIGPYEDYADIDHNPIKVSKSDKCKSLNISDFNKIESKLKTATFVFENEDDNLVLTEFIK